MISRKDLATANDRCVDIARSDLVFRWISEGLPVHSGNSQFATRRALSLREDIDLSREAAVWKKRRELATKCRLFLPSHFAGIADEAPRPEPTRLNPKRSAASL